MKTSAAISHDDKSQTSSRCYDKTASAPGVNVASHNSHAMAYNGGCACGGGCPSCESKLPILTKLAVSQPGDAYEQEADSLADQVMRMAEPTLQRACAPCTAGALQCPKCEEAEEGLIQRAVETSVSRDPVAVANSTASPAPSVATTGAPSLVNQALAEPGHSLDQGMRSRFEPSFGADFGNVRVHNSTTASASAAAVGAMAYTIGEDVVFGSGHYAPATSAGQRLLAHELVHVLQSRGSGQPTIRRQATPTTLNIPPNICDPNQTRAIIPSVATAQQWLRTADTRLTSYLGAMTTASSQPTALSLLRHFAASDANTVRYVQNRIRTIADRLRTDPGAPNPLTVECHGPSDTSCSGAGAYVLGNLLVFCPSFFGGSQNWQIEAMIHEIAHSLPPATGPLHITDRAYQSDRLYGSLSTGEALTNAESYALLVQELAVGRAAGTAARDTYEDCPTDWRAALFTAVSRAQSWVHHAQVAVYYADPVFMAAWATQASTFLGGQSAAQLAHAASAYDQMSSKLDARLDYECETGGGGRCSTAGTYWYAIGDFHICPSWRSLATDDDRAEALLAGLFGYYEIVDDNNRRWNLAKLARALTGLFWVAPTAAELSAALTSDAAQPQPPAAPLPGPRPSM